MTRKSRIWCIQKHGFTPPTLLRLSALASASAPSRTEVAEKHAYRHPLKKRVRYSKQTLRSTVRYARRRAALPQLGMQAGRALPQARWADPRRKPTKTRNCARIIEDFFHFCI